MLPQQPRATEAETARAPKPAPEIVMLTPWDLFVLRHRKPGNLVVHFVSAICFFGSPLAALALAQPWLLVGFFASGMLGAAGHYLFDDSGVSLREATIAVEVPYFVLVMFYKIARGTYAADIERSMAKARVVDAARVHPPAHA